MIEFSLTEVFLLVWAIVVSILFHIERQHKRHLVYILGDILSNKTSRDQAVARWEEAHK